jgi:hypothetical protein
MFCNGCLLQNENVSRLNVLVSCPAAKQRNRLKALLLLSVPLPRNPRAAPAKNFQKRVSRFAIANPKNQPDFQIPWHRLLLLKVLEEYGNNSFSANFNREANNSLFLMYVFVKSFIFSKRRGQKFQNLKKSFQHYRIRKHCRIYSSPAASGDGGCRRAAASGGERRAAAERRSTQPSPKAHFLLSGRAAGVSEARLDCCSIQGGPSAFKKELAP